MTKKTVEQRFWEKVEKGPGDSCWLWTSARSGSGKGYGQFWMNGRQWVAHRLALHFAGVEIPEGMEACHRCDVFTCVRPDHLFVGTHAENMADLRAKGYHPLILRTHCKYGHPFDEANTLMRYNPRPRRVCRACHNQVGIRRRARNRVARLASPTVPRDGE